MAKQGLIFRAEKYLLYFYALISALAVLGLFPWNFVRYAAYAGIPIASILAIYLTIDEFTGQNK